MEHQGIWDICSSVEIVPVFVALNNRPNKQTARLYTSLLSHSVQLFGHGKGPFKKHVTGLGGEGGQAK